jgi:hypothetical protein
MTDIDNLRLLAAARAADDPMAAYALDGCADEIERLRAALEEIAHMGFDMPATLDLTDEEWRRRRTASMQNIAKQAVAQKEPD